MSEVADVLLAVGKLFSQPQFVPTATNQKNDDPILASGTLEISFDQRLARP